MSEYTYDTPIRLNKFRRELVVIPLDALVYGMGQDQVSGDPLIMAGIVATPLDDAQKPALDAAVAAHDPYTPDATETTNTEDVAAAQDFHANFEDMIADLDQIEQRLTESKANVDAALAEGQASPPQNVNQVWQKTRTALQELSEAEQQTIRLTRVARRTVKAQRAALNPAMP